MEVIFNYVVTNDKILLIDYSCKSENGCQLLATGWWFSPDTPVPPTNKTDCQDIIEILLKVELNTTNQTENRNLMTWC